GTAASPDRQRARLRSAGARPPEADGAADPPGWPAGAADQRLARALRWGRQGTRDRVRLAWRNHAPDLPGAGGTGGRQSDRQRLQVQQGGGGQARLAAGAAGGGGGRIRGGGPRPGGAAVRSAVDLPAVRARPAGGGNGRRRRPGAGTGAALGKPAGWPTDG